MRKPAYYLSATILLAAAAARAESDPAAARAQLQQGYALKQQGKCEEAVPHFLESVRLDRQPKGFLNLGDCEEKLGKLATAQSHFVEARDLSRSQGIDALRTLAEQRLQTIEKRLPKLVVKLAKDAPRDTAVTRDNVTLGAVSLGTPLPLDPGTHAVVVRGGGYERRYEVIVSEGSVKELEVTPIGGKALEATAATPQPSQPAAEPSTKALTVRSEDFQVDTGRTTGGSGRRTAAIVVGGIGVVAAGVGTALLFAAKSSYDEAANQCPGGNCTLLKPKQDSDDARTRANLMTIPIAVGGAAIVTGVILWLTAPKEKAATVGWVVAPSVGASSGMMTVQGSF